MEGFWADQKLKIRTYIAQLVQQMPKNIRLQTLDVSQQEPQQIIATKINNNKLEYKIFPKKGNKKGTIY